MKFATARSILLLATMFAFSGRAEAGEQDGVRCPSGFDAEISDGNRALICTKRGAFRLNSTCPLLYIPSPATNQTTVDRCFKLGDAGLPNMKEVLSSPSLAPPGYPPLSKFKRIVGSGNSDDVFVAYDFKFPEAGPIYLGDASRGVHCPSGWDGDSRYSGLGIRCDKRDGSPKEADCDSGWTVDRDRLGQEDRCLGINEGSTKAMGMTKVQFDAERALATVGWVLDKRNDTDLWQKKLYRYSAAAE